MRVTAWWAPAARHSGYFLLATRRYLVGPGGQLSLLNELTKHGGMHGHRAIY
jgi:hypothetical protein